MELDSYCKQHTTLSYCKKINRTVPPTFCLGCQGDCEKWRKESVLEYREKHTPKLTEEQKNDTDVVSVVMPARDCEEPYIQRTIDNLRKTAVGEIEIILICDGWQGNYDCTMICSEQILGQRASADIGAAHATGKYIYRLDPHSAMSAGWDARMKSSCGETDLIVPVYDHIDPETWEPTGKDTAFWWLDRNLRCYSIRPWIPIQQRKIEEEAMAMSGGAWMIHKKYYDKLGGHDQFLGPHGAVGPEWSLKVWLTGGRVLIRTDVVCSHLFRAKSPYGYDRLKRENAFAQLCKMWIDGEDKRRTRPIEWLLYKFNNYTKYRPVSKVTLR